MKPSTKGEMPPTTHHNDARAPEGGRGGCCGGHGGHSGHGGQGGRLSRTFHAGGCMWMMLALLAAIFLINTFFK